MPRFKSSTDKVADKLQKSNKAVDQLLFFVPTSYRFHLHPRLLLYPFGRRRFLAPFLSLLSTMAYTPHFAKIRINCRAENAFLDDQPRRWGQKLA